MSKEALKSAPQTKEHQPAAAKTVVELGPLRKFELKSKSVLKGEQRMTVLRTGSPVTQLGEIKVSTLSRHVNKDPDTDWDCLPPDPFPSTKPPECKVRSHASYGVPIRNCCD